LLKYDELIEISFRSSILCVRGVNLIAFTDQTY